MGGHSRSILKRVLLYMNGFMVTFWGGVWKQCYLKALILFKPFLSVVSNSK